MLTPYKGKVKILCKENKCIEDKTRENVTSDCINCPSGLVEIINLEEQVIAIKKFKSRRGVK